MLEPLPTLTLPPGAARRVFLELFLHAARRAPDGLLRVEVAARQTPEGTEVRVRDDGPALSALGQKQAFDPFAALPGEGPAFGLFLARQLVEAWGGTFRLESQEGTGCRVIVTVPTPSPTEFERR